MTRASEQRRRSLLGDIPIETPIDLTKRDPTAGAYVFKREDALAIDAAYLSGRPLLILGEPGTGKSLFALAAAVVLDRAFTAKTVDRRTDPRDLLWTDDPVPRLADAQMIGSMTEEDAAKKRKELDVKYYVTPGPLWWGFHWKGAFDHLDGFGKTGGKKRDQGEQGVVVLIDEIDKADADVPNGLLEALGNRRFDAPGYPDQPVVAQFAPLIIITSNEERRLPAAFLRRCAVHHLNLPDDPTELVDRLVTRGKAHFPKATKTLLTEAAEMTRDDRLEAKRLGLFPPPGQAEFIDLISAALAPRESKKVTQSKRLGELRDFFLRKHADLR